MSLLLATRRALLRPAPAWVTPVPGLLGDIDWVNNRAWAPGLGEMPATATIACTRANQVTSLLASAAASAPYLTFANNVPALVPGVGLNCFNASQNNLLNSTAPATQTTASLGVGTYTLWVNGTGSATSSAGTATGSGFGAATDGAPNTFSVTVAGTVVITVAGSLVAFQLEPGSFGTPLIVTAGAALARAADVNQLIGPFATAAAIARSMLWETSSLQNGTAPKLINFGGNALLGYGSTTTVSANDGANIATGTFGSGTTAGLVKASFDMDGASMIAIANGGAPGVQATSTWPLNATGVPTIGNRAAGDRAVNGPLRRLRMSSVKGVFQTMTV